MIMARTRLATLLARWPTIGGIPPDAVGDDNRISVLMMTVGGGKIFGSSPARRNDSSHTSRNARIATAGSTKRSTKDRTSNLERLCHAPSRQRVPLDVSQPDLLHQEAEDGHQRQRGEHDVGGIELAGFIQHEPEAEG